MRKSQLENLKIGDKVQEYGGGKEIYTVLCLPDYEVEDLDKYIIGIPEEDMKLLSKSSLLKNYKLIEEEPQTEIAVTVEVPDMVGYLSQGMVEEPEEEVKEEITEVELITSRSLAEELNITPQDLRRILRRNKVEKPEGGWKWQKDSEELKEIMGILEGVQEKRRIRA